MTTDLNPRTDFVPADAYTVEDLDTLKVLADPLRLRIRELMREPTTVKQVAAELDIPPTKLYYHINLLEKHGLIVLVDTRIVSGIIEKHYQVSAKRVRVSRHLLSPTSETGEEGMTITMTSTFDSTKEDLIHSMRSGIIDMSDEAPDHKGVRLGVTALGLTDEQAADFYARLGGLLKEFTELSEQNHESSDIHQHYRIFYALFPSMSR